MAINIADNIEQVFYMAIKLGTFAFSDIALYVQEIFGHLFDPFIFKFGQVCMFCQVMLSNVN